MEMIRIKDIAEQAGVSPTTVSNVIHGNTKKVSAATIDKIQKLLQEVSYIPSMGARMLAENRSRIIGVLVGSKKGERKERGNSFANLLISALEKEIFKRNYYMMLHLSASTMENLQLAASWNVEGLITIGLSAQDNLKIQSRCKAPVISIDNYYEKEATPNIGLDDFNGGYLMGEFLIKQGHKDIAFVADNDIGVDHYRWLGFKEALTRAGITTDPKQHILFPEQSRLRMEFYEVNYGHMSRKHALFFASDYYALEAINYMQDKGIRIPEDLSIAGFDNSEYAMLSRPLLTTVHQDVAQKGVAAVEKLFAFIEGKKDVSMSEKLPVHLIVRDSVNYRT